MRVTLAPGATAEVSPNVSRETLAVLRRMALLAQREKNRPRCPKCGRKQVENKVCTQHQPLSPA